MNRVLSTLFYIFKKYTFELFLDSSVTVTSSSTRFQNRVPIVISQPDVGGYWMQAVFQIFSALDANTIVFAFKTSLNWSCDCTRSILIRAPGMKVNLDFGRPQLSTDRTCTL